MESNTTKKSKTTGLIIFAVVFVILVTLGFISGWKFWLGDDEDPNGNGNGDPLTCDGANQQLNTAGSACECVYGYSFDDDGTTCVLTCDGTNQQFNTAGDACECVEGYSLNTDGTACIVENLTCDANLHKQNNAVGDACECVEGYSFTNDGTTCVENITCDTNENKVLNATSDACICMTNYAYDRLGTSCVDEAITEETCAGYSGNFNGSYLYKTYVFTTRDAYNSNPTLFDNATHVCLKTGNARLPAIEIDRIETNATWAVIYFKTGITDAEKVAFDKTNLKVSLF